MLLNSRITELESATKVVEKSFQVNAGAPAGRTASKVEDPKETCMVTGAARSKLG
jgi:hypothetical protein